MQPNHIISQPDSERETLAQQLRELTTKASLVNIGLTLQYLHLCQIERGLNCLSDELRGAQQ